MPQFYMTFARKINNFPFLHDFCPKKNIFPDLFFWGGDKCSLPPVSYAYASVQKVGHVDRRAPRLC